MTSSPAGPQGLSAPASLREAVLTDATHRSHHSRVVRNVLSNWGAFVFAALVSFFLSPFLVRSLGDARYGVWVLLVSIVGYLGLLDLGVRGAVTRYVARFHAAREHDSANRVASTALAVFAT